jgi:hypothetical protein
MGDSPLLLPEKRHMVHQMSRGSGVAGGCAFVRRRSLVQSSPSTSDILTHATIDTCHLVRDHVTSRGHPGCTESLLPRWWGTCCLHTSKPMLSGASQRISFESTCTPTRLNQPEMRSNACHHVFLSRGPILLMSRFSLTGQCHPSFNLSLLTIFGAFVARTKQPPRSPAASTRPIVHSMIQPHQLRTPVM